MSNAINPLFWGHSTMRQMKKYKVTVQGWEHGADYDAGNVPISEKTFTVKAFTSTEAESIAEDKMNSREFEVVCASECLAVL